MLPFLQQALQSWDARQQPLRLNLVPPEIPGRYSERTGEYIQWPGRTASGVYIAEHNALTLSDYFKCVNLGSRIMASLPWKVYEPAPLGKKERADHYLYPVVHNTPNDLMTSFTYRSVLMRHVLSWGNHWSFIERQGYSGRTVGLWPIQPHSYRRHFQDAAGQMWWVFQSSTTGEEVPFRFEDVLHIPWLPYDGILGCTPIRLLMDAAGAAKATELYAARFFGNNARPDQYLSLQNALTKEGRDRLKKSIQEAHGGENQHMLMVLEEGAKIESMSMDSDHAQFLETRKFQRSDVCGWFPIPPHLIGDLERSTNNNIEQQSHDVVTFFISIWAEAIEQEINRRVFMPRETGTLYTKFIIKGLMRGDTTARTEHYKSMWNIGAYTDNDILEMEDMNGYEGGDEHWVQLSMTTVENAKKLATEPAPAPNGGNTDNPPPAARVNAAVAEMQARTQKACVHIFRDLVGRILQRKPESRAGFAAEAAMLPLLALSQCIFSEIPEQFEGFLREYSAGLGVRTASWRAEVIDTIIRAELAAATKAIMERGA